MSAILNNKKPPTASDTLSLPRVLEKIPACPRVTVTLQGISDTGQAKMREHTVAARGGPTTRSKYVQALKDIVQRQEIAHAMVEMACEVFDEETGKQLKYRQLINHPKYREIWMHSSANEFGRLAQGVGGRIQGTNTIFFIYKHQVPSD